MYNSSYKDILTQTPLNGLSEDSILFDNLNPESLKKKNQLQALSIEITHLIQKIDLQMAQARQSQIEAEQKLDQLSNKDEGKDQARLQQAQQKLESDKAETYAYLEKLQQRKADLEKQVQQIEELLNSFLDKLNLNKKDLEFYRMELKYVPALIVAQAQQRSTVAMAKIQQNLTQSLANLAAQHGMVITAAEQQHTTAKFAEFKEEQQARTQISLEDIQQKVLNSVEYEALSPKPTATPQEQAEEKKARAEVFKTQSAMFRGVMDELRMRAFFHRRWEEIVETRAELYGDRAANEYLTTQLNKPGAKQAEVIAASLRYRQSKIAEFMNEHLTQKSVKQFMQATIGAEFVYLAEGTNSKDKLTQQTVRINGIHVLVTQTENAVAQSLNRVNALQQTLEQKTDQLLQVDKQIQATNHYALRPQPGPNKNSNAEKEEEARKYAPPTPAPFSKFVTGKA